MAKRAIPRSRSPTDLQTFVGPVCSEDENEDEAEEGTGFVRLIREIELKQHKRRGRGIFPLSGTLYNSAIPRMALAAFVLFLFVSILAAFSVVDVGTFTESSPSLIDDNADNDSSYVCSPRGMHLAPRTDVVDGVVSMTVSFHLPFFSCRNKARPVVHYGRRGQERHGGSPAPPVEPLSNHYMGQKTDGKTILSDSVFHVELPNLQAGEQSYWYRIEVDLVDDQELEKSPAWAGPGSILFRLFQKQQPVPKNQHYFKTPPLPGRPTSVAIVADWGDTTISRRTVNTMIEAFEREENPISQVIVAGDITYADSRPWLWSKWFQEVEVLFQHVPLIVSVGNHEIECDVKSLEVFSNYEMWFHMPNRIGEAEREPITQAYKESRDNGHCTSPLQFLSHYAYGNSFYAYTQGQLKVIVLNPYTLCTPDSVQYTWLYNELKHNVDRSVTPWVMAVVHTPFYSTFHRHRRIDNLDGMEYLFNRYNVNIVVSGHDHGYMRTANIAEHEVADPSGMAPYYFIVGTGGSGEGPAYGYKHPYRAEPWVEARSYRVTGFGELMVHNATHADWEYRANHRGAEAWYFRHVENLWRGGYDKSDSSADDAAYTDRAWLRNMHV